MKKVIRITTAVFATIALVGFVNFTQAAAPVKVAKKDVPEAVLSSFTKMYPQATVITYSREIREGKTCYELESKDGTTKRDIRPRASCSKSRSSNNTSNNMPTKSTASSSSWLKRI